MLIVLLATGFSMRYLWVHSVDCLCCIGGVGFLAWSVCGKVGEAR